MPDHFQMLPAEILEKILVEVSKLSMKDFFGVRIVCKRFNDVIDGMLENVLHGNALMRRLCLNVLPRDILDEGLKYQKDNDLGSKS